MLARPAADQIRNPSSLSSHNQTNSTSHHTFKSSNQFSSQTQKMLAPIQFIALALAGTVSAGTITPNNAIREEALAVVSDGPSADTNLFFDGDCQVWNRGAYWDSPGRRCFHPVEADLAHSFKVAGGGCKTTLWPYPGCDIDGGERFLVTHSDCIQHTYASVLIECPI